MLSVTGTKASTIGQTNPIRYRGYYYDSETEFYYLRSRYYDPTTQRFINADIHYSTGQGILGNNMFVYCNNNPVNYIDPTGQSSELNTTNIIIQVVYVAICCAEIPLLKANPKALVHDGDNGTTYSKESTLSVIARMLYGEDHRSPEEHLWVLENRRIAGNYGGHDFRELILAKNQFTAMLGVRSLNPASKFDEAGEREAWELCVDMALKYLVGGIEVIPKHHYFPYTYTHKNTDAIQKKYPDGCVYGGTWFYNK